MSLKQTQAENLRLLAKHLGYQIDSDCERLDIRTNGGAPTPWNPYEDDGDALRLANKFQLVVDLFEGEVCSIWGVTQIKNNSDEAVRQAIVTAALKEVHRKC